MTEEDKEKNAIKKTKEMLEGMKDLGKKMREVQGALEASLDRHRDTLLKVDQPGDLEEKVNALLDINAGLARAQAIGMGMTLTQLDLTMEQMGSVFDLMIDDEDAPGIG